MPLSTKPRLCEKHPSLISPLSIKRQLKALEINHFILNDYQKKDYLNNIDTSRMLIKQEGDEIKRKKDINLLMLLGMIPNSQS